MTAFLGNLLSFSQGGETMARRLLFLIITLCISLISGCSESGNFHYSNHSKKINGSISQASAQRLLNENLSVLESVEPWENIYGPGLVLVSEHYKIYTTMLEPLMLRQIPGFMESAFMAYNRELPVAVDSQAKFAIYLFSTREQWEDFTDKFAGEQAEVFHKIKVGAYYLNGACVVYDIGREQTFAALGHEGWHQFNSRFFSYRLPSWLDEGMAMLFENAVYDHGVYYFEHKKNKQRTDALAEVLAKGKQIPLKELISISPGEVLASDMDEPVKAFYSQSYALVRYLIEAGGYAGHNLGFRQMLWDGLSGKWPLEAEYSQIASDRNLPRTLQWNRIVGPKIFSHYICADYKILEKAYFDYCRCIAIQGSK
jgi:hypothetical protein